MSRRKNRMLDQRKFGRPGVRTKIYVRADMIGGGKIDLLRIVGEEGSISGAAKRMGIGYRRAWFLLETLQRCFAEPLITTRRGGARPGGASLTPLAEELIRRHEAHARAVEEVSADYLTWLEEHQSEDVPDAAE